MGKKEFVNGDLQSDIRYIYGGTGVLQERSADGGTVLKTFTASGELDYTTTPPTPRYYTRDHLGSVREVVAEDGSLLARYDYKPYGERILDSGTYEAAKGFTGHDYLPEAGMILTRYRGYDPLTGRWLSPDPIAEAGGMNLYGYVLGDPVNSTDSLGLVAQYGQSIGAAAIFGVAWELRVELLSKLSRMRAMRKAADCGAKNLSDFMSGPGAYAENIAWGGLIGGVTGGVGRAWEGLFASCLYPKEPQRRQYLKWPSHSSSSAC